jgi:ribosome-binding ATPase YchF (GTP1/OBG family)
MKVGIVGDAGVGKTTLFTVLTGQTVAVHHAAEHHLATVEVVDPRLDRLRKCWNPKKFTRARFDVEDEPAVPRADAPNRAERVAALRDPDVLLLVIGACEETVLQLPKELADPLAQRKALLEEFTLFDLEALEKRLQKCEERVKKGAGDRAVMQRDVEQLKKIEAQIEKGRDLRELNDPEARRMLHELRLFTEKPIVTVFNVGEAALADTARVAQLHQSVAKSAVLCAPIEREIAQLEGTDRADFLREYHLSEPASPLLTRLAYEALDLVSFFTMGEDEVRAWPIARGSNAVTAAGRIHSDLARGFIRAEVISWKKVESATDLKQLKALGHADLMGKDYVVQDGDILNIRFSV